MRDSVRESKNLVWMLAMAALQHRRRVERQRRITDCQKSCLVYSLLVRDAQGFPDQRGLRPGADVQIGGGVRVSDAFQAVLG